MAKTKVLVSGCNGKMGRILCEMLKNDEEFELFGGFDVSANSDADFPVYTYLLDIHENPDIIIDFSSAEGTSSILQWAAPAGIPVVIGTTKLPPELVSEIKDHYSTMMPIFLSSNMSWGVAVLTKVCQLVAELFSERITILDEHHDQKADAPSGTAISIFNAINKTLGDRKIMSFGDSGKLSDDEISVASLRGGDVTGNHTIKFFGNGETLILSHVASSRQLFAEGALKAASFLFYQDVGFYNMDDLFDTYLPQE